MDGAIRQNLLTETLVNVAAAADWEVMIEYVMDLRSVARLPKNRRRDQRALTISITLARSRRMPRIQRS